jgi:hypothetical protein
MKLADRNFPVLCGLLLMLAAFPVFGQEKDRNGLAVNKRPLKDFASSAVDSIHTKKVDLEAPFTVVISADLANGQDGKTIILVNPKLLQSDGDPGMQKLVQDGIIAIGDSGWLGYLANFEGVKKAKITVSQDGSMFRASITAETKTGPLARQAANALNSVLTIGKMAATKPDDKTLLDSAAVSSAENTFTIGLAVSKNVMIDLIKRKLNEALEREKENSAAASGKPELNARPDSLAQNVVVL